MSRLRKILATSVAALLAVPLLVGAPAQASSSNTLLVFDTRPFIASQPSEKLAYDHLKLLAAIQGLVNRDEPRLYLISDESAIAKNRGFHPDTFWLDELTEPGAFLAGRSIVTVSDYEDVLDEFVSEFPGVVVWDGDVPATANLASTAAGVEELLPVRYDSDPGSPYQMLVTDREMTVGLDLVGKFTGTGTIPDTSLPSSGSAKNDAYRWAMARWVDTELVNPKLLVYALDAVSWSLNDDGDSIVAVVIPETIEVGQSVPVSITLRNTSPNTWTRADNDRLGSATANDLMWTDLNGGFSAGETSHRVFLDASASIAPGQTVTFGFTIVAPDEPGNVVFAAAMVRDGIAWYNGINVRRTIEVVEEGAGPALIAASIPEVLEVGESAPISITFRNNSSNTWTRAALDRLASISEDDLLWSGFDIANDFVWTDLNGGDSISPTSHRVFLDASASVAPGQEVTFDFTITAPATVGTANLSAGMVRDGVAWYEDIGITRSIQIVDEGEAVIAASIPSTMVAGQSAPVSITFRNTSANTWTPAAEDRLASIATEDLLWSGFDTANDFVWTDLNGGYSISPTSHRVFLDASASVAPDQEVTFDFTITAPATVGTANLSAGMVRDGVAWYEDIGITRSIEITAAPQTGPTYPDLYNSFLVNSDYYIANKAFFFDLSPDATSIPNDDRDQALGTDHATFVQLLTKANQNADDEVITVGGFPPWFLKYSNAVDPEASLTPVQMEWGYADLISGYMAQKDADAFDFIGLANASVYRLVPLASTFAQINDRGAGSGPYVPGRTYVTFYMGDYDSAAWTAGTLPALWSDPARGELPLAWPPNTSLSARIPQLFNYLYETQTTNDYFVGGDNGVGYLNPMMLLAGNRPNGLPDGLATWEEHNRVLYEKFDLDLTGFLISGNSGSVPRIVQESYARFSPAGVGTNAAFDDPMVNGTPFMTVRWFPGTSGDPAVYGEALADLLRTPSDFHFIRDILVAPSLLVDVIDYVETTYPELDFEVVDPYTLFRHYAEAEPWQETLAGTYEAPLATTAPSIDGVVGEGEWSDATAVKVSPRDPFVQAHGTVWGSVSDDADLTSVYRLMWDEDYLYLLEERQDDAVVFSQDGPELYLSDAIMLFLDTDGRRSENFRAGDYAVLAAADSPAGTPQVWLREGQDGAAVPERPLPEALIAAEVRGDGYTMELAVPWAALTTSPFQPEAGGAIGFTLLSTDDDGDNWGQVMWAGDGEDQSRWASLTLLPAGDGGSGEQGSKDEDSDDVNGGSGGQTGDGLSDTGGNVPWALLVAGVLLAATGLLITLRLRRTSGLTSTDEAARATAVGRSAYGALRPTALACPERGGA